MIRSFDLALFQYLNGWAGASPGRDMAIVFFAQYLAYLCVAAFFLFLVLRHGAAREKIRIFRVAVLSVIIARLGITEIIRFFYHRPRPFTAYHVHQLIAEREWSFPSGHAAFFFAMAAAIYGYDKKWGRAFFAASIAMGIARVIAGVHYPSDILGGAMVGIGVAYAVFYFAEKRTRKEIGKAL